MENDAPPGNNDLLEPQAMVKLSEILLPLDEAARRRVLAWAVMKFGGDVPLPSSGAAPSRGAVGSKPAGRYSGSLTEGGSQVGAQEGHETQGFRDVADLFESASPQTQNDAVLVASYWIQVVQGQGDFEGATVNAELRHMGRQHPNITRALSELEDRKPAYVIVVRKGGRTAQARKLYRLTQPAIRAVEEMIAQRRSETS